MSPEYLTAPGSAGGSPAGAPTLVAPTLVYDGDCAFCRRCAAWIGARLPAAVTVVPSQSADLAALDLSPLQAADAAWWIEPDGRKQRGHRAVAASLRACGGAWGLLGRLLAQPGLSTPASALYGVVAKNRHRLGCGSCRRRTRRGGPALS